MVRAVAHFRWALGPNPCLCAHFRWALEPDPCLCAHLETAIKCWIVSSASRLTHKVSGLIKKQSFKDSALFLEKVTLSPYIFISTFFIGKRWTAFFNLSASWKTVDLHVVLLDMLQLAFLALCTL